VATSTDGKHLDHGSFMTLHKKVEQVGHWATVIVPTMLGWIAQ
jgi:hypothetical protein